MNGTGTTDFADEKKQPYHMPNMKINPRNTEFVVKCKIGGLLDENIKEYPYDLKKYF